MASDVDSTASEVYLHYKKTVKYDDKGGVRAVKLIARLLMDGHEAQLLTTAADRYATTVQDTPERYRMGALSFYCPWGKPNGIGEPEWLMYVSRGAEEILEALSPRKPEKAPVSPCEPSEEIVRGERALKYLEAIRGKLRGSGEEDE